MADQETLPVDAKFDPVHGLWKRFVDNDAHRIRDGEWLRACAAKEFVGTCRECGDYLVPCRPTRAGTRWDYEAECRNQSGCGTSVVAPGGRLAKHKAARTGGA